MDIHYWFVSQSVSVQQGGSLKSQPMAPRFQQLVERSPLRVKNGHGEMGRQSWVKFKAKALMFPPSPTSGAMHYLLDIITPSKTWDLATLYYQQVMPFFYLCLWLLAYKLIYMFLSARSCCAYAYSKCIWLSIDTHWELHLSLQYISPHKCLSPAYSLLLARPFFINWKGY